MAGKVDLGDVLLTPSNDPNPPGLPFTVTGKVLPLGTSDGTIVTLKQAGTPVRIFTVGVDGRYSFWILPGAYTVSYQRGALTAAQQSVTVVNQNTMVTVPDATLH